MYIKNLKDCPEFISGDHAVLRELLHADKGDFAFGYSLAHAIVKPGHVTTPHRLKTTEVYYILEGEGLMHINEESSSVKAQDAVYKPPHARQYIANTGKKDLIFICIVDPAWQKQDEEVEK